MITRTQILIALLLSLTLFTGRTPAAEQVENIKLPPSIVTGINFTNMTFTIDTKGTNMTLRITSQTRFFKDGKYAISKDLKEGELVRGIMERSTNGHPHAVRVFWGLKSIREK